MKKLFLLLFILLIGINTPYAQEFRGGKHDPKGRLAELEKIKLLETLDMDEETTLKFFSRRNTHQDKMKELFDSMQDKSDQISKLINDDAGKQQLKKAVNEYLELEKRMPEEKAAFIASLSDILDEKQLAKVVIFEKKFREEVRKIIIRERGKSRFNGN
ncbi:MAG: hypothetical protein R6W90_05385 [Ignavibacteriaceae bacterium]